MESVYNALKETSSDIVMIHDGARPRIKEEYIDRCLEQMDKFKGATVAVKAKDTIKICDDNGGSYRNNQKSEYISCTNTTMF